MEQEIQPEPQLPINPIPPSVKKLSTKVIAVVILIVVAAVVCYFVFKNDKADISPIKNHYIKAYIEGAKKGHEKALEYVLDHLFFTPAKLSYANPSLAFEIYQQAKKANPSLRLIDNGRNTELIQMCAEPGSFDVEAFIKKYNITDEEQYGVWSLAEEASIGGRFGKPDPKLVFNLVCRSGTLYSQDDSTFQSAVTNYYNWKNGDAIELSLCDYSSREMGSRFCMSRDLEPSKKRTLDIQKEKLQELGKNLDEQSKDLLANAYKSAEIYIEMNGRGLDRLYRYLYGTMGWSDLESDVSERKDKYLHTIEKIRNGWVPAPKQTFSDADKKLNKTYQALLKNLEDEKFRNGDGMYLPYSDDVKAEQLLWITYRDNSAKLFSQINSSVDENVYKSWLTEIREGEILSSMDMSRDALK